MYERFTARARHAVALAQDEARGLDHNYLGTEHLLLGLLAESDGIAARALTGAGVTLEGTRALLLGEVGRGAKPPTGEIPFTPHAKLALELALREALGLGHNYIGTEHVLLGLVRDGKGTGFTLITHHGLNRDGVRRSVLGLIEDTAVARRPPRRPWPTPDSATQTVPTRTTRATDDTLDIARRLAGTDAVGSHHLLLATLTDPASAATKALTALGLDLESARRALTQIDVTGTTDELPEQTGRRLMTLRLAQDTLTRDTLVLETADTVLIEAARTALAALDESTRAAGIIPGDLDVCVSLADVWKALNLSLKDIQRCARPTPNREAVET